MWECVIEYGCDYEQVLTWHPSHHLHWNLELLSQTREMSSVMMLVTLFMLSANLTEMLHDHEKQQQTVRRLLSWWIDDNLSVSQTRKAGVFQGQTKLKVISFRLQITAFYWSRNLLWVEKYLVFIIWDDGVWNQRWSRDSSQHGTYPQWAKAELETI